MGAPAVSLSKTWNVAKLTSETSSSLSVISWLGAVERAWVSAAGTAVAADAPPASDNDTPTAPNTGKVSFRLFRFETCGMIDSSVSS
jgi:hypothetical protein